jgi:hypothetical protein
MNNSWHEATPVCRCPYNRTPSTALRMRSRRARARLGLDGALQSHVPQREIKITCLPAVRPSRSPSPAAGYLRYQRAKSRPRALRPPLKQNRLYYWYEHIAQNPQDIPAGSYLCGAVLSRSGRHTCYHEQPRGPRDDRGRTEGYPRGAADTVKAGGISPRIGDGNLIDCLPNFIV